MDRVSNTNTGRSSNAAAIKRIEKLALDDQEELNIDDQEKVVVYLTYNHELLGNDYLKPAEAKIEELNIDDDEKAVDSPNVLTMFDKIHMSNSVKPQKEMDVKSFRRLADQRIGETAAEIERTQRSSRYKRIFSSMKKGAYIETISIPGWHVASDVVFYEVVLSNKQFCWNCWIRFSSFTILHLLLKDLFKNLTNEEMRVHLPPFPEKQSKMLTDHFSEEFIENRRALLENYLQKINLDTTLRYAEDFISFLLPPQEQVESSQSSNSWKAAFSKSNVNSYDDVKRIAPSALDELTTNTKSASNSPVVVNRYRFVDREKKLMLFVSEKDEITGISVKATTTLRDQAGRFGSLPFVIYHVHVRNTNMGKDFNVWIVMKRFHEFVDFDEQLRAQLSVTNLTSVSQLPKLPPKFNKSWTDHLNPVFIEKRRILLQVYLRRLIRYPLFRRHPLTLTFLGVQSGTESVSSYVDK